MEGLLYKVSNCLLNIVLHFDLKILSDSTVPKDPLLFKLFTSKGGLTRRLILEISRMNELVYRILPDLAGRIFPVHNWYLF